MTTLSHSRSPAYWRHDYAMRLCLLLLVILSAGCASLPENYPRTESSALSNHLSTSIGKRWASEEAKHPGKSGFTILRYGHNAFTMRIGMIDLAEKTLDLQVYIWEVDETGRILAERLIRAADRGVRVRLLVDDMGAGADDHAIASMDAHPNIEIRIFNPFAHRDNNTVDFLTDLKRVNHRMHNKTIVADNSLAVIGGRNIGDHYFSVNPDTNFRDLDICAVGPVVRDISRSFDHFWQGVWSVPIAALVDRKYTAQDLAASTAAMRKTIAAGNYPYAIDEDIAELRKEIAEIDARIVWAPGRILWDDPATLKQTGTTSELIGKLEKKLHTIERSFTIESAYFVVRKRGLKVIKEMVARGVKVRVLTNSLASNDVLAAHAGHASYRKQLLEAGVEMYELRADSGVIRKDWNGEPRSGLHTKAMVFDNASVFIGSFNLDPRSANINTESGIYVESPALAAQLLAYMDEGIRPENSYRLTLDEDGDLLWTTQDNGVEVTYHKDPLSSFWQRFSAGFINLLPVESQL